MDRREHAVLAAELNKRLEDVGTLAQRIEERAAGFAATAEGVDSMAYQLHNLYGACEQLLEYVARSFENQIDQDRYHTDLVRRMTLDIDGVRPALLSGATGTALDELRRFRHLFRHAYSSELDPEKVAALATQIPELQRNLVDDLNRFLEALRPAP